MKLGKTSRLVLILGVLVILFAGLGVARSQQVQQQDQLSAQLEMAEMRLGKFPLKQLASQQEELEGRLSSAESELRSTKAKLSKPTTSIALSDALFDIAEVCQVEVVEINSAGQTKGDLEGVACSILPLSVKIEGNVANMTDFVIEVTRRFPTCRVQAVDMDVPYMIIEEEESGDETEEETETELPELGQPSADISLVVYFYQGG